MTEELATTLRRSAMDCLARREHSRQELLNKLQKKYPDSPDALFSSVLDKLEDDRLLSDARFTEAYIRYRKSKGYGPLYIRQHLQSCRVDAALISEHLRMDDPEWLDILQLLLQRKFGSHPVAAASSDDDLDSQAVRARDHARLVANQKARQKLQRFVLSRGFTLEQLAQLRE